MRDLITLVENAFDVDAKVHYLCVAVADHFKTRDIYFFEGDCLNFAVAMHEVLAELGVQSEVKLLMRSDGDSDEGNDDVLSHVILAIGNQTYDSQGRNAERQWETDFNHIRRMNGDEEEWFYQEDLPASIPQFLASAQAQHGDADKMVDKPELRDEIKAYVRSLLSK